MPVRSLAARLGSAALAALALSASIGLAGRREWALSSWVGRVHPAWVLSAPYLLALLWLAPGRREVRASLGARGRAAGAAALTTLVAAGLVALGIRAGTGARELSRGLQYGLSLELLARELGLTLLACGLLAAAPGSLLRAISRRPEAWVLTCASAALFLWTVDLGATPWSKSWRRVYGWGRPLLLGAGVGLGAWLGLARARFAAVEARPPRLGRWTVSLALLLSLGWPGRPLWSVALRPDGSVAAACAPGVRLEVAGHGLPMLLGAAAIAAACASPRRGVQTLGLALLAAHAALVPLLALPAAWLDVNAPRWLLLSPAATAYLSLAGALFLAALALRGPRPPGEGEPTP